MKSLHLPKRDTCDLYYTFQQWLVCIVKEGIKYNLQISSGLNVWQVYVSSYDLLYYNIPNERGE